ncbi:MAG: tetratricopeptide repeat protein [Anaerolineales bacterium]|nr:tetratricopeptide repeat protein [Anaerolineales bacterium]
MSISEGEVWTEFGNIHSKAGSLQEAIHAYKKAIELDKMSGWPYSNLAVIYVQQGHYAEAIALFQKSLSLFNDDQAKAITWNRLAEVYAMIKDYDNAVAAYQMADEVSQRNRATQLEKEKGLQIPSHPPPFDSSLINDSLEKPIKRIEHTQFFEGQLMPPPLPDGFQNQNHNANAAAGVTRSFAKSSNPCSQQFPENGIETEPCSQHKTTEGDTFSGPFNFDETPLDTRKKEDIASEQVNETIEPTVSIPEKLSLRQNDSEYLPEPENQENGLMSSSSEGVDSNALVDEHLESDNQNDEDINNAIQSQEKVNTGSLFKNGKSDQVEIERYQKIIEANPESHRAWDALGKLFRVLGQHQEAVDAFEKAVALDADQVDYHYNLGLAYATLDRYDEAVVSLQTAVQIDPEFSLAHATLAGYYKRLNQDSKADEEIRIAQSMMKNESEYNRACFAAICGDNQDAVNLLRVALENKQTSVAWVAQDPDLDFIRDDPEFQILLKEAEPAMYFD